MTRRVYCAGQPGNVQADDSLCDPATGLRVTTRPASQQTCTLPACTAYAYVSMPWGACSVTCGSGVVTRQVYCAGGQVGNFEQDDSLCVEGSGRTRIPMLKPASQQSCVLSACIALGFLSGSWGACSVTCGSGVATRDVYCAAQPGNNRVADSLCSLASSTGRGRFGNTAGLVKPAAQKECTQQACLAYAYVSKQWGACSVTCGSGVMTRQVYCAGGAGQDPQDDSLCVEGSGRTRTPMLKPSSQQPCTQPACMAYTFLSGSWGACSVTCGSGIATRDVYCLGQPGNNRVADSLCSAASLAGGGRFPAAVVLSKPTAQQTCAQPACLTYTLVSDPWGVCSVTCGSGITTRQVYCAGQPGGTRVSDSLCVAPPAQLHVPAGPQLVDTCAGKFGTRQATAEEMHQAFVSTVGVEIEPVLWGPPQALAAYIVMACIFMADMVMVYIVVSVDIEPALWGRSRHAIARPPARPHA